MKTKIFKVQRPLFTNQDKLMFLYYRRGKQDLQEREPTDREITALGDDLKMYAAYRRFQDSWLFVKRVSDRNW